MKQVSPVHVMWKRGCANPLLSSFLLLLLFFSCSRCDAFVGLVDGWKTTLYDTNPQAFFLLGVDSHRYMSFLLDKAAKAKGVRLICLDRPGRGRSSDFQDKE